jgi:universal stress protein A
MQEILLFVKKLPYSIPAILMAELMARLFNGRITLFHANKRLTEAEGQQLLEDARDRLPQEDTVVRFARKPAIKGILDEIDERTYNLVILQGRHAIRLRKRLGEKIARLVARESPISVLVVKREVSSLQQILVCTGGLEIAEPVIRMGASLAKASGAELTLLHVITPVPSMYTGLDEIEETLSELLQTETPTAQHLRRAAEKLSKDNVAAHLKVRQGEVADEILQEIEDSHYDMVIMGASPGHSRVSEWLRGDVTGQVVNHAPCPVLIVRR